MRLKVSIVLLIAAPVLAASLLGPFSGGDEAGRPLSLSDAFAPPLAVADTDEDGLPDSVTARVVVPDDAGVYHIAAAAEVAARLAHETVALSFPLAVRASDRRGGEGIVFEMLLLDEARSLLEPLFPEITSELEAGMGAVLALPGRRVVITGFDGPGMHEAAAQFSGRWPNAWEIWGQQTSILLKDVEGDVQKVLEEAGFPGTEAMLVGLVYEIDRLRDRDPDVVDEEKERALDGMRYDAATVKAAVVSVALPAGGDLQAAREALRAVPTSHRRGERVDLLNYPGIDRTIIKFAQGEESRVEIPRFSHPARLLQRRPDPAAVRAPKPVKGEDTDLADLYSLDGLYSSQMGDKIPDRIETLIILGPEARAPEVADFAARLSLECAGVSLPLVAVDLRPDQLERIKQPILIGRGLGVAHLEKTGRLREDAPPAGEGRIDAVRKAFNQSNAVVVSGDDDGIARACRYLASNYPGLTSSDPGGTRLVDIKTRAGQLLAVKNPAGQLSNAVGMLAEEMGELQRRDLSKLEITIALDKGLPGYGEEVERWAGASLPGVEVNAGVIGRRDPKEVFSEEKTFDYEVDEFKALVEEEVLPAVVRGAGLTIDARLSEPPAVLTELDGWLRGKLRARGADLERSQITLICAYKQGFHWLRDIALPRLRGLDIGSLLIRFRPYEPDFQEMRKFYPERSRWLSELYPIDEVIAGELGIPLEKILFEMDTSIGEAYSVEVLDPAGRELFSEGFSPKTAERKYLEQFPHWARIEAPTGWLSAQVGGTAIVDTRIRTDPERFWDYYQEAVLKRAYDHVLEETGKKPTLEKQPFFNKLEVEVWMSEPDERLGVDEEHISSLEALHEDVYFDTLDFFNGMLPREAEKLPEDALYTTRIGAPGSVIPLVHPSRDAEPPEAKVTFLGNSAEKPILVIRWTKTNGEGDEKKLDILPLKVENVRLSGLTIGAEGAISCEVEAVLPEAKDIGRFSEGFGVLEAGRGSALFAADGPAELRFRLQAGAAERTLTLACAAGERAAPALRPPAEDEELVSPGAILGPDEAIEAALRLGRLPGYRVYRSGVSYQGHDIYAIEVLPESASTHFSQAKLVTYKPTILITGRQHANEVSSTTHILRLAELLHKDNRFGDYRRRLNIVLLPMENPDGAALSERLIELNPSHMNHAGRYTALGVELGTQHDNTDTLVTEALVRPRLWNRWLPDVYLNCHGYPSHEWVQPFSGYSPYQFRDYWIPRGWFVYLTHLDDPRAPDHRTAGEAILRYIDDALSADPEQAAINSRIYNRYWRWAGRWQPHIVNYELHGKTMIYAERRSDSPRKPSERTEVTVLEGTPEAMDETPVGRWMEVVVGQGLSYLEAHLRLLVESRFKVERLEEESGERIHRTIFRRRPVLAKAPEGLTNDSEKNRE